MHDKKKKKLHLPYPKITCKHSKLQEMLRQPDFAIISLSIHEFALTSRLSYLGPTKQSTINNQWSGGGTSHSFLKVKEKKGSEV